jgi:hypothetical protein
VYNNIRQRISMHHQMSDCNKIAGSQNVCFLCRYSTSHRKYGFSKKQSFFPSVHKLNSVDTWNKIFLLESQIQMQDCMYLNIWLTLDCYTEKQTNILKLAGNSFVLLRNQQNVWLWFKFDLNFIFLKKGIHARFAKLSLLLKISILYINTFFSHNPGK